MPTITIDRQDLFYTRTGPKEGVPSLLLIHGAGGSRLDWPPALRRLPDTAVYAIDLPGHGRSAKPGRAAIDAYADVIARFIQRLNLDPLFVAGHSMGGAIAQALGLRHLPQVQGLILIGTGAKLRVNPAILDAILTDFEQAIDTITEYAWGPHAPDELVSAGQELMLQADPEVTHDDYTACNNFNLMDRLDEIETSTLVISGMSDKLTPHKYGRYLADNIPNAQFVSIPDGGHMVALEQPGAVATAVRQFIHDTHSQI